MVTNDWDAEDAAGFGRGQRPHGGRAAGHEVLTPLVIAVPASSRARQMAADGGSVGSYARRTDSTPPPQTTGSGSPGDASNFAEAGGRAAADQRRRRRNGGGTAALPAPEAGAGRQRSRWRQTEPAAGAAAAGHAGCSPSAEDDSASSPVESVVARYTATPRVSGKSRRRRRRGAGAMGAIVSSGTTHHRVRAAADGGNGGAGRSSNAGIQSRLRRGGKGGHRGVGVFMGPGPLSPMPARWSGEPRARAAA